MLKSEAKYSGLGSSRAWACVSQENTKSRYSHRQLLERAHFLIQVVGVSSVFMCQIKNSGSRKRPFLSGH